MRVFLTTPFIYLVATWSYTPIEPYSNLRLEFMLKIQLKDKRQDPVWVVEKVFSIGSASDNNLVITDSTVSAHHARLLNEQDGFLLQDTSSAQGTFVNGHRVNQRRVGCGDTIRCGAVDIAILDPLAEETPAKKDYWALIANASWLAGQEFPLTPDNHNRVLIGRGKQCDIVFPGTHLSREHARIKIAKDYVLVTDLNSANGTYVNDARITSEDPVVAVAGDKIRLDIYSFTLLGPGMALPQSASTRLISAKADTSQDADSGQPKRWKTRPTSPGNREELQRHASNYTIIGLSLLLIAALVGATAYLFVS